MTIVILTVPKAQFAAGCHDRRGAAYLRTLACSLVRGRDAKIKRRSWWLLLAGLTPWQALDLGVCSRQARAVCSCNVETRVSYSKAACSVVH